jgi:RimJ/RimL family protein N-acetyltransferase
MEFKKFEIPNGINKDNNALCVYLKLYKDSTYVGQIFYFKINDTFHIGNFNIRQEYRGKGYGTLLLQKCLDDIKDNYKIKIVKLTDISERFNKSNNIYIKFGFKYDSDEKFNSDMVLLLEP